ncbi:NAD-dependent epimerase/dehydratase family protein [Tautonia plasticadhaerens]|uniref:NAD dependent epimerase/dehydratase family protein n=1 Tax=Tautonia plasticadhaerens TaxID=2527974 RepID=A0A518H4H4_9BACT|nr:NAD(P)-dependent oxidoreductase [Tautonia plasticadhaerens]QDV35741.1 NAD dependent epimerase/dehydratase family protein [Tautonia plasticadhaerens]
MPLVLITGATGQVARGVLPILGRRFDLRLLSPDAGESDPRHVRADLLDLDAITGAMLGVDAVLHLAKAPGHPGTFEDDAFNDLQFDVNVKGTHHVFEAARRAGVRRVVCVSSLMVVWGYGASGMVPGDAPPRPVGTYALTKALAEQVAGHFGRSSDLEAVILRIAAPLDPDDPDLARSPVRPQQVPLPDLAEAFALALTVPLPHDEVPIVTIVGESSRRRWDLGPARRLLGFEPKIRLDDLGVSFADPFDVPPGSGK